MKLYTIHYNFNTPSPRQLTIPTNTQYKIGVKAVKDGEPVEIEPSLATLKQVGTSTVITADASTMNGYVTFGLVTADAESFESYKMDVDGDELSDFNLMVNVKAEDVGDVADPVAVAWSDVSGRPTDLGDFTNEEGYITSAQVEPYSNVNYSGYATKAAMAATMNGYATNDANSTPPNNLLTFAFLAGVPTVTQTTYAPWTLSKWDGEDLAEPVSLEFNYYGTIKVKVGFISKAIVVNSFAWVYRDFNGGYAYIIKAEADATTGFYSPTGMAKTNGGDTPAYLDITLSNDNLSIATIDGQSDKVTCTRTSSTRQITTKTLMYADEVAAAISAATSTFVTATAMAAAISAATSTFVTASAMESYVDAQIGAVLSSSF